MEIDEILQIIEVGLHNPVETWPSFSPRQTPLVVFDEEQASFLHHPNPPPGRPPELMAATAQEIGGVLTATLPLWMCQRAESLLPLVYHECFHVYQDSGSFKPLDTGVDFNFHEGLVEYPELNPTHRALCRAETRVLNDPLLSIPRKASLLAALNEQRLILLTEKPLALTLIQMMERKEGTAFYIQQQVDFLLNQTAYPLVEVQLGYFRQYTLGAAVCHLLNQLESDWQRRIEAGASPSQILAECCNHAGIDLAELNLEAMIAEEKSKVEAIQEELLASLQGPLTRIQVPKRGPQRGFNPRSVRSLGDGRLLHTDIYFLQGSFGTLKLKQGLLVEDFEHDQIMFPAGEATFQEGCLEAETDGISIHLTGVTCIAENIYKIGTETV